MLPKFGGHMSVEFIHCSRAELSGAQLSTFSGQTIGPRTVGPQSPNVQGPICLEPLEATGAPDSPNTPILNSAPKSLAQAGPSG